MIPGPVQLAPEVLAEMSKPIVPHYGHEWTSFYNQTIEQLRHIFQTDGDIYVIPGSGSVGLDAGIGTVLAEGERMLVLSNGFFGDRLGEIARHYRGDTIVVSCPVSEPLSPGNLDSLLEKDPTITWVAICHSESSSGLLNPIRSLADICHKRGVRILIDAISSLGGIELEMDAWSIDVCVSASQKCLEGPPGLAIVAVARDTWEAISNGVSSGWYSNLRIWRRYADNWADWHPYPITMAVPAFRALRIGLDRIHKEGLAARFKRHRTSAETLRSGATALGYPPVFPTESASPTIVALRGRPDVTATDTVRRLAEEHQIKVASGMGEFKNSAFRIGNMGIQATPGQIQPLLDGLASLSGTRRERG